MRLAEVGTPVAAAHGDDAELGDDDGGTDGRRDLLGGLDAETDVALRVTNDDDGLEPGALTGTGLLLDGLDLFLWNPWSVTRPYCFIPEQWAKRSPISGLGLDLNGLGNSGCRTFMTSSLSLGRKVSTIWYSLMGSECR